MSEPTKIDLDKIINLLENMIDARIEMALERQYENHNIVSDIRRKKYDPVVQELVKIIKNNQ